MKKKFSFFLLLALSIAFIDQIMKLLIVNEIIPIPFTTNTGAGFGLLQDMNSILIWIAIIVIGAILYYHDKLAKEKEFFYYSVALIFGGALGNLIDRIRLGYVIDFIDLRIWPSFNIADAAITIGSIAAIYYLIKKK